MLLDLNLPRKSGFDVLSDIKSNTRLRDLTVIVFSSSTLPHDRARSMELGANDYLHKDGDFHAFVKLAKLICEKMTAAA